MPFIQTFRSWDPCQWMFTEYKNENYHTGSVPKGIHISLILYNRYGLVLLEVLNMFSWLDLAKFGTSGTFLVRSFLFWLLDNFRFSADKDALFRLSRLPWDFIHVGKKDFIFLWFELWLILMFLNVKDLDFCFWLA